MALIYTFSFDSRYVGYEATVTDADGVEVTGSPVTLDAAGDGTISLTTLGHYRAAVFNTSGPFGDGYSVVDCVLDEAASIAAGGGGGETDGVGAMFFGGDDLAVDFDNTYNMSTFVATDDPPRAPQRDDLMMIDSEDDTIINVVRSGLCDISLNVPVQPRDLVVQAEEGPFQLEAVIQVWVAGNTAPPAYDYNNRAQWRVTESVNFLPTVFTNWTFPQVLQAGDTIQLAVKATAVAALGTLGGAIHLDPDITFVLTYRGPVAA